MGWESWVIGISVGIIAIAFVVLVIFVVGVLIDLRRSLQQTTLLIQETNNVVADVERKLHAFDPVFRAVDTLSETLQKQANSAKYVAEEISEVSQREVRDVKISKHTQTVLEVAEWAMLGFALWKKIKKR